MRQYDVCKFTVDRGKGPLRFLIVLQSGDFSSLKTVIVAPVAKVPPAAVLDRLHIPILVEGSSYHIQMPELAAYPVKQLGQVVDNASDLHQDVMSAIDLLFAGF